VFSGIQGYLLVRAFKGIQGYARAWKGIQTDTRVRVTMVFKDNSRVVKGYKSQSYNGIQG